MPPVLSRTARRLGAAFCLPALLLSGCAMAGDPTSDPAGGVSPMQQRFIVRYTPGSEPEQDPTRVVDHVARTAREAGLIETKEGPRDVVWIRRLAVGADLVAFQPGLEAAQAQRLLDALQAEPDVVYAEPDGRMTIGPGPDMPMKGRTRD